MFHFIYKVSSKSGKYYIGRHSTKNLHDGYLGSGKWIRNIKDKSSLVREIIEYCDSIDDLMIKEKLYIEKHIEDKSCMNFHNSACGFGSGKYNFNSDPERKQILRERVLGNKNPMWGKTHKEETKRKIALASSGRICSSETREKLSASISKSRRGIKISEEGRLLLSLSRKRQIAMGERIPPSSKGLKWSESSRKKLGEAKKLVKKKQCEFCDMLLAPHTYKRWHGVNCKFNTKLEDSGEIESISS